MEREHDMEVEPDLTERQRVILPAVICIIRAHTRQFPITSEKICDLLNFWLRDRFGGDDEYGPVRGTDIRDIARHCRSLPWPETVPICSSSDGYYFGYEPEDFKPFLRHMGRRIQSIARSTRPMTTYLHHLQMGAATGKEVQDDLFGAQVPAWIKFYYPPKRDDLLTLLDKDKDVQASR